MSATSLYPPTMLPRDLDPARNRDGIEQDAHLFRLHNGRDAYFAAELRAFDEQRRVIGNDLLDDEPVEKPT